jgi:toxin ParE2
MQVVIGAAAKRELDEAIAWYDAQLPGLGKRFAQEVHATVSRIVAFPRLHAELDKGIRRALIKTFPYGVIYAGSSKLIEIIAIAHMHRRPRYWKGRR